MKLVIRLEVEKKALKVERGFLRDFLKPYARDNGYTQDVTGDACEGDEVIFLKAIYAGHWRKRKLKGYKLFLSEVLKDWYENGIHFFLLRNEDGRQLIISGNNIYKNGLFSKKRDYTERLIKLKEKHARGKKSKNKHNARR